MMQAGTPGKTGTVPERTTGFAWKIGSQNA